MRVAPGPGGRGARRRAEGVCTGPGPAPVRVRPLSPAARRRSGPPPLHGRNLARCYDAHSPGREERNATAALRARGPSLTDPTRAHRDDDGSWPRLPPRPGPMPAGRAPIPREAGTLPPAPGDVSAFVPHGAIRPCTVRSADERAGGRRRRGLRRVPRDTDPQEPRLLRHDGGGRNSTGGPCSGSPRSRNTRGMGSARAMSASSPTTSAR